MAKIYDFEKEKAEKDFKQIEAKIEEELPKVKDGADFLNMILELPKDE